MCNQNMNPKPSNCHAKLQHRKLTHASMQVMVAGMTGVGYRTTVQMRVRLSLSLAFSLSLSLSLSRYFSLAPSLCLSTQFHAQPDSNSNNSIRKHIPSRTLCVVLVERGRYQSAKAHHDIAKLRFESYLFPQRLPMQAQICPTSLVRCQAGREERRG